MPMINPFAKPKVEQGPVDDAKTEVASLASLGMLNTPAEQINIGAPTPFMPPTVISTPSLDTGLTPARRDSKANVPASSPSTFSQVPTVMAVPLSVASDNTEISKLSELKPTKSASSTSSEIVRGSDVWGIAGRQEEPQTSGLDLDVPETPEPTFTESPESEPASVFENTTIDKSVNVGASKKHASQSGNASHPGIPTEAIQKYLSQWWSYVRSRDRQTKMKWGAAAAGVVLLVGLVLWFSGRYQGDYYLDVREPLLSGPGESKQYVQIDLLEVGDHVVAYEKLGEHVMVRDDYGRVGFVRASVLVSQRLEATTENPFAGCRPFWKETDVTECHSRGQDRLSECRDACDTEKDQTICLNSCQQRFADCLWTCDGQPQKNLERPVETSLSEAPKPPDTVTNQEPPPKKAATPKRSGKRRHR